MRVSTYCVTSWLPLHVTRMPGYLGVRFAVACFVVESATGDIELISENSNNFLFPFHTFAGMGERQIDSSFRIRSLPPTARVETAKSRAWPETNDSPRVKEQN